MTSHRIVDPPTIDPIRIGALLFLYIALWAAMTPYAGLTHDAQVYAFQAIARGDALGLGQDVFLKYRSQDAFSVFPQLYAAVIDAMGLEPAAATLTLTGHVLWFLAAFMLSKALFGTRIAWLCVGLLIALPSPYGGQRVFHLAEPFLTARLPGEVLALTALWAWVSGRRVLAVVCLPVALAVHPLMAFPALLLCAFLWLDEIRPHPLTIPMASVAVVIASVAGSVVLGGGDAVMSNDWVTLLHWRSQFLFLDRWLPSDWDHTILSLATVTLAALAVPDSRVARVGRATVFLAFAGMLLAAIASQVWHLEILMQGQPWRWTWLTRFMAIIALPAILAALWRQGPARQGAAVLLVAAWLFVAPVGSRGVVVSILGSLLALLSIGVFVWGDRLPQATQVLIRRGAVVVGVAVLVTVAIIASLGVSVVLQMEAPTANDYLRVLLNLIAPAVLVATGAWYAATHVVHRAVAPGLLAAAIAVLVVTGPAAFGKWTQEKYGESQAARFHDWQAAIPPQAEVFWWDGLRETWFLLNRRSYLTLSQGGGVVFSEDVARELWRRAGVTSQFIDRGYWFNAAGPDDRSPKPLSRDVLTATCSDPILGFVVSTDDIGTGAPRKEWPGPGRYVHLYDCADFRPS